MSFFLITFVKNIYMKITEDELFDKYNIMIDNILDECDWKTHFTSEEVCSLVHTILKENNEEPSISEEILHKMYSLKIDLLKITREEWVENYGIKEIINILYKLLESIEGPENLDLPLL